MGRTCTVCSHKDLDEINRLLLCSDSYRDIARQFGLSKDALARHKKVHISELLSKSKDLKAEIEGDRANDTLSEVRDLKVEAQSILSEAREAGDLKTALLGIDKALKCLELIFRAEGRIQEQSVNVNFAQVSIYDSPEWDAVGALLARVLGPYPDLRREIARELLALAQGGRT